MIVDIHCHILPGIDDGAADIEESIRMAKQAVGSGISHVVATPHIFPGKYENSVSNIKLARDLLLNEIKAIDLPLKVAAAAEVHLSESIVPLVEDSKLPFIGSWEDKRVLLLELPNHQIPYGTEFLVDWLQDKGISPMIAHPERNRVLMNNMEALYGFIDRGCLLQTTLGAFVGMFGERVRQFSKFLLNSNLITVIASDAHSSGKRSLDLTSGLKQLESQVGENTIHQLLRENPLKISNELFQSDELLVKI